MEGRAGVTFRAVLAAFFMSLIVAMPAQAQIVIAHRGASGERPEHTLAAYERAIDQGADYIEPDLVPTKDGVLVARHENEISGTTDVASRAEFADRRTTKLIDGHEITGWFTEDFTLAELRSLRARERMPEMRPANTAFDGLYGVPTLREVLALVKAKEAETGRRIGLYPEIKHPAYFQALGHDVLAALLRELAAAGYDGRDDPVFIQCFEVAPLIRARQLTDLRLVQLVSAQGGPADREGVSYREMLAPSGLAEVADYADGIGPDIRLVLTDDGTPTDLVQRAHALGLAVHPWTLRRENAFLPEDLRSGEDLAGTGDIAGQFARLRDAGIDGVFTDNPADVIAAK